MCMELLTTFIPAYYLSSMHVRTEGTACSSSSAVTILRPLAVTAMFLKVGMQMLLLKQEGLLQENAAVLLGRQRKEHQWYDQLMPYWTSLPKGNGSIFCRHLFTEQEIALLQSDSMVWLSHVVLQ